MPALPQPPRGWDKYVQLVKVLKKVTSFFLISARTGAKHRTADQSRLRDLGEAEPAPCVEDVAHCKVEEPFVLRWESRFQQDSFSHS